MRSRCRTMPPRRARCRSPVLKPPPSAMRSIHRLPSVLMHVVGLPVDGRQEVPPAAAEPGLLFYLSGDHGFNADYAANGNVGAWVLCVRARALPGSFHTSAQAQIEERERFISGTPNPHVKSNSVKLVRRGGRQDRVGHLRHRGRIKWLRSGQARPRDVVGAQQRSVKSCDLDAG